MKPIVVEVCAGSYEDALAASRGGAKRIELNSALSVGGLSPSVMALIQTKKNSRPFVDLHLESGYVRCKGHGGWAGLL